MRRGGLALLAAAAVLLAGCSGTGPRTVQRVKPAHVPFALLSTAPTDTASFPARGPQATIYFVRGDRLARSPVPVAGINGPADAVRALLGGPTSSQAAAGLSTDIPDQTRLVSLDVSATTATVDLSSEFGELGGAEQILGVAQLVYTLTASPRITAVLFAIGGKPVEVPDSSGSLADTPRSRDDYRQLAPK